MISERALKTREEDIEALFRGSPGLSPADPLQLTHPPEVLKLLAAIFARLPGPAAGASEPEKVRINMHVEDTACVDALLDLCQEHGTFDLEMVLLRGVDPVSHFFRQSDPQADLPRGFVITPLLGPNRKGP